MRPWASDPEVFRRANELFRELRDSVFRRTDQLFARLLLFEWAAGVVVALVLSPRTWIGTRSEPHVHLLAAMVLGGAIVSLPVYLVRVRPGQQVTRYVIASAQMLMSALLIHLSGGRIETHFHVFGSLAFLGFYRDWKVFVPATLVVAVDHMLRGIFYPMSVFGIVNQAPWRWVEHAGWVLFCDAFLIQSARQNTREMWETALHQAGQEKTNEVIEATVEARTEELRLQQELFRRAFENAPIGMALVDEEGRIRNVNAQMTAILRFEREALVGKSLDDLLEDPASRPDDAEVRLRCGDGGRAWVLWRSSRLSEGEDGRPCSIVQLLDVTQRKKTEQALRESQRLESIGLLAGGIAHEINTPTQYVGDNLRFLQEAFASVDELLARLDGRLSEDQEADLDYLRSEIPSALSQSLEGVDRVAAIVRSMKEYSHTGGEDLARADLGRILENTITVSRNEWKYVAELSTDFDPDVPEIYCNRHELGQVFLNILVNAAHAVGDHLSPDGPPGSIHVSTRLAGDTVEVRISDSGPGIPEAIRDKVFEPFFTTKEVGRGTGQGLAISHAVVVKLGGMIDFETETGKGTTFRICLPTGVPDDAAVDREMVGAIR
ncbi:MAG: ATP-binding protein [Candidatus Eremiobacterota bacterium]